MSDVSTGQSPAEKEEPSDGLAPSEADPRDDARWLGAFLLAHRGKMFHLDEVPGADVGPASAVHTGVPTDVIEEVMRAVQIDESVAPGQSVG